MAVVGLVVVGCWFGCRRDVSVVGLVVVGTCQLLVWCRRDVSVVGFVVVGTCQLLVLAAQGQVYHFQNLQLTQLKEGLCSCCP